MSKLLNAVVKYPAGKTLNTQYGEKVNAVFECGGEEIKIWADAHSTKAQQLKNLTKGEHKLILHDGGGKYKLLDDSQTSPQPNGDTNDNTNSNGNENANTNNYVPLSDDKKRAIAMYVQDMSKLYSYCLEQAKTIPFKGDFQLPPEAVKDIAATLFISAQRHFNL